MMNQGGSWFIEAACLPAIADKAVPASIAPPSSTIPPASSLPPFHMPIVCHAHTIKGIGPCGYQAFIARTFLLYFIVCQSVSYLYVTLSMKSLLLIHLMRVVAENFLASVVSHSGLHPLRPFCPSPILLRTETQFTQLERVQ